MKELKNKKVVKLNKLDYAVLAILHNCELSGYDITNRLKHFWKTSHSRVYPTLAKLEGLGLLKHVAVRQSDRPDKKIYKFTKKGTEVLKEWVVDAEDDFAKEVHDQALLKLLCADMIPRGMLIEIVLKRREKALETQNNMRKMLENINIDKNDYTSRLVNEVIPMLELIDTQIYTWILENNKKEMNEISSLRDYLKEHLF